MFHFVYNHPRIPVEERIISIDEAVRIIQEKGVRNQVLTLQGNLRSPPLMDEGVRPIDLLERIRGFFGSNPEEITVTSRHYGGKDGESKEHYLHLERDDKKLVVKYSD